YLKNIGIQVTFSFLVKTILCKKYPSINAASWLNLISFKITSLPRRLRISKNEEASITLFHNLSRFMSSILDKVKALAKDTSKFSVSTFANKEEIVFDST